MTRKIRIIQEQNKRVETGAIQFGGDWPGLFIRGDDCIGLMLFLQRYNEDEGLPEFSLEYRIMNMIKKDVLTDYRVS